MKAIFGCILMAASAFFGYSIWQEQAAHSADSLVLNAEWLAQTKEQITWLPHSSDVNLSEIPHWKKLTQSSGVYEFVNLLNTHFSSSEVSPECAVQIHMLDTGFIAVIEDNLDGIQALRSRITGEVQYESCNMVEKNGLAVVANGATLVVSNDKASLERALDMKTSPEVYRVNMDEDLIWKTTSGTNLWFSYDEIKAEGFSEVRFKKRKGFLYGYGSISDSLSKNADKEALFNIWDFQVPHSDMSITLEQFPIRKLDTDVLFEVEEKCECDVRVSWKSWNTNLVYQFRDKGFVYFGLQSLQNVPASASLYPFIDEKVVTYKGFDIGTLVSGSDNGGLYADLFGREVSSFIDLQSQVFFFSSMNDAKRFISDLQENSFQPIIPQDVEEFLLIHPAYTAYDSKAADENPMVFQFQEKEGSNYYHSVWKTVGYELSAIVENDSSLDISKVSRAWEVEMSSAPSRKPFIFTNHYTKEKELLIISGDKLELLNKSGESLWKRNLKEEVLSEIHQVDLFRNSKNQIVFSTKNYLYAVDRNGKDVENFPVKFDTASSGPVSVMDYENKRKYRLLVPLENGELMNIDKDGKPVRGWKHQKEPSPIVTEIKHVVAGRKDYLIGVRENRTVAIYKRDGRHRHAQNIKLPKFNRDKFYIQESKKIEDVELYYEDSDKQLIKANLSLDGSEGELLGLASAETVLIGELINGEGLDFLLVNKNTVSLYDQDLVMNYSTSLPGEIAEPLTVAKTSNGFFLLCEVNKDLYVIDEKGKTLDGFPVYGGKNALLFDLDNDKRLELITLDDSGLIISYNL